MIILFYLSGQLDQFCKNIIWHISHTYVKWGIKTCCLTHQSSVSLVLLTLFIYLFIYLLLRQMAASIGWPFLKQFTLCYRSFWCQLTQVVLEKRPLFRWVWVGQLLHWSWGVNPPPLDNIWAMMIVWRMRRRIIWTVLCCIVYCSCAQWYAHLYEHFSHLTVGLGLGFFHLF